MDFKKLPFSDHFSSFKKLVLSGFGFTLLASVIFLTLVFFNFSFSAPFLNPVFQGFHNASASSSWPFPFSSSGNIVSNVSLSSRNGSSSSSSGEVLEHSSLANQSFKFNYSGSGEVLNFTKVDDKGVILNSAHEGDLGSLGGSGKGEGEESVVVNNGSGVGVQGVVENKTIEKDGVAVGVGGKSSNISSGGVRYNGGAVGSTGVKNGSSDVGSGGVESLGLIKSFYEGCDIFNGRWVRDDTKPFYPPGSCPFIDRDFDCHRNGRPDRGYLKWKWQPYGCEMPSLNATDFLERLRGKKLVFVGDSLNRNMWESLVCILRQSIHDKKRVYEISGKREFKKKGVYAFRFEDYDCTVDFVASPFLVKELSHKGKNGSYETLRLDVMDQTTSTYHDADVIVFNTGHWWTHEKTSKGENYYQEGNYVYPMLKVLEAYKRALNTWARWVDKNIDSARTHVLFRGYSVTHFRGGPWNSGGQCHNESEPIYNDAYLTRYPSKMKALHHVLDDMKTPVIYLNISRLTDYRKDGHPSIYRKEYRPNVQVPGDHVEDCSHWCLPGVPDTWNELLYASLLQSRKGSWGV